MDISNLINICDELASSNIGLSNEILNTRILGQKRKRPEHTSGTNVANRTDIDDDQIVNTHNTSVSPAKPHKCKRCDHATTCKSALTIHMRKHTGIKPFKCDQCDYAAARKSNLTIHTRKHTGNLFKCEQCDYATAVKINLTVHMRTHTGDKPHKCQQCDYATIHK